MGNKFRDSDFSNRNNSKNKRNVRRFRADDDISLDLWNHHFSDSAYIDLINRHYGIEGFYDYDEDEDEVRYWKEYKRRMERRRNRETAPRGMSKKITTEFLGEMFPNLIHKPEEVLKNLNYLNILKPINSFLDEYSPEKATDIFTTDIPKIVDYAISIDTLIGWLETDVKKIWPKLSKGGPGDEEREEAIELSKFIVSTYREGLRSLRRKVKERIKESEERLEAKKYHDKGLDVKIEDFFEEDPRIVTLLENSGINYLFQLLSLSKNQALSIKGIGNTLMDKIEEKIKPLNITFWGKDPDPEKPNKNQARVVDIKVT